MRKRNLEQVLKVRGLLEDLARAELEMRASRVRQLEEAAARRRGGALAIRQEGWAQLAKGEVGQKAGQKPGQGEAGEKSHGQTSAWLLGLADAEILESRSQRLKARAEAEKPAVAEAREAMLERRRERQQIETLVEAAGRAEAQERARREQQLVDDWFQGRAGGRGLRQED